MRNFKKTTTFIGLSCLFLVTSCRSTDNITDNPGDNLITNGSATLKFNLSEGDYTAETLDPIASLQHKASLSTVKVQEVKFVSDDQPFIATLTPVSSISKQAAIKNTLADVVNNPLKGPNVKYRVIAYRRSDGTKASTKVYTIDAVGNSTPDDGIAMALDGDTETVNKYDFVVLSYNSSVAPADVTGNISAASLTNISGNDDLMYFRADNVRVTKGDNLLSVVLKHKFSQITTIVDASAVASGNGIKVIDTPAITNQRATGNSIKLSNGVVTYGTTGSSKSLDFTGNSTANPIWTSKPLLIANPGAAASDMATLTFNSMTVGTKVKTNISVPNLVISPEVRYNLNLKFACTAISTPSYDFNMYEPATSTKDRISQGFTFPAANAGFTFEVYELDNSFNLKINGVDLANQEIQFESGISGLPQNIRFKSDKTLWGASGNSQIYNINGSTTNPKTAVVRIKIGPDGSVSMMGRRNLSSPLELLELFGGAQFNRITWKSDTTNDVVATMKVTRLTQLVGYGEGRKVVPCP
ncbi:hypothetical protein CMU89_00950 [Elizabethkingia anophelis]|uniref:hypothetical protein n=1 Tax=Elizabethkingia anophelis TaxID=1117645 RepID=UPI000C6D78F7|nr:hypothetical protein [Elizabethkingia anophelis]MDV3508401.1 hypothetical protein [Elizabethkingia anophelis]MDV3541237.1 hypothetical protein [Elizabethkingia anophelis]PKR31603.1 hypothetical protein CWH99_12655 [Elizabethkingia anophelis]PKR33789.1 hypothetical protein CWI00_16735 [Elizabethkingia anophelis]PRQ78281.1 hypothetical protein CMT60_18660 [Elizabethkingia anophelis]